MVKTVEIARAEWRASEGSPKPDVSFVPMMERRRLTGVERAAFAVAHEAMESAGETRPVPVVFASRWGEIGTTLKLMRQMHDEGEMSPAGFSASVHNAAPGAWSLFTRSTAPYTAIAARGRSKEMGLLEARSQLEEALRGDPSARVLFVYAEEATPEFYEPHFGEPCPAMAEAVLLGGEGAT